MTRSWMVRLGRFGEREMHALQTGELLTGWRLTGLQDDSSKEAIAASVRESHPNEKVGTLQNWAVQINQLANSMVEGDLVIVPLKTTNQLAIGRVVKKFSLSGNGEPMRNVEWLRQDLPRDAVKQDLLYSLGASQTICEISRNDAAKRFDVLAQTGKDPGPTHAVHHTTNTNENDGVATTEETAVDVSINARDQIERHIAVNFTGHTFTQLIGAILRAQGYQTRVSPPGTDNGVDIVAGLGALGFDGPRLVVQVKSGDVVADQPTLQSLIGCVSDTHAEHGLLVSWSGFTVPVRKRTNELYFRVRLWGRDEIMDALFSVYDKLPEEIRAELPLRRIWSLVVEE